MDGKSSVLNRLFTQNSFKEILESYQYENKIKMLYAAVKRCLVDTESKSNGEVISEIYRYIGDNYRNEYFYKNTLLNKLLLGVHKPTTTTALTEIPIGNSKADFVMINGKAVVYEIKTALDSFERLGTQLKDYYRAFDNVVVLTDEKNCKLAMKLLRDTPVGVYLLTKRNKIHKEKLPVSYTGSLNSLDIFKVLNKNEYESVIMQVYGELPKTTDAKYYRECFKLFDEIDLNESYNLFKKELKKRNKIIIEEYADVPYELKSLIYFSNYGRCNYNELMAFLKADYIGGE